MLKGSGSHIQEINKQFNKKSRKNRKKNFGMTVLPKHVPLQYFELLSISLDLEIQSATLLVA